MKAFLQKKRVLYSIIAVLVLVVAFFIFMPKGNSQSQVEYLTEKVTKGDIAVTVSATGKVVAKRSQAVLPQLSGKVWNVYVGAGDEVTEGQVLAEIENEQITNAVEQAESMYRAAASARQAIKNAPTMPGQEAIKAQQLSSAQASINRAKENLDKARESAEKLKIKAPFSGEVITVAIKVGDTANPAQAAFSMQTSTDLEVTLQVNEIDVVNVTEGQAVSAEIDAVRETRKGKIYSVVNTGDVVSGVVTYLTKVRLDDTKSLRPGMSVNAELEVASKKGVIIVPSAAISQRENKSYVKKVTGKDSQGQPTFEEKEVSIGLNNNTIAEVESGLAEGDQVILTFEQ